MNYGVIKKLVFSVLLICGIAVGSSNAFAVTGTIKITGLDANQHFSIPDLGVNGEADENGEFVTDLACNPDDDEDKTSSGQTTDSMGNPVMLLCLPNGSFFTSEELLIGGTAALGAFLVQSIDQNTIEGTAGLYPHTGTCTGGGPPCGFGTISVTCSPATGAATSCTYTWVGGSGGGSVSCGGGSCSGTVVPPSAVAGSSGTCSFPLDNTLNPTGGTSFVFCSGTSPAPVLSYSCSEDCT